MNTKNVSPEPVKTLILIGAPPASGKTWCARKLARALPGSAWLDLDMLEPMARKVCEAAGEPFNKKSPFFRKQVRDTEYETLLGMAYFMLRQNRTVIVSAPFTKEFHDPALMQEIRRRAVKEGAGLKLFWVLSDEETCKRNMYRRAAARDSFNMADFDWFVSTVDFSIPETEDLTVIDNRIGSGLTQRYFRELASGILRERKE